MELLKDPKGDRQVKDIKPPPHKPLSEQLLYPGKSGIPDWKVLRDHLSKEGRLTKPHLLKIISQASAIFKSEPNLVKVKDPVMVVGDTHGQFYDFLQIITLKEKREEKSKAEMKFLFLGDYVDRGSFGVELLTLLYALKINYPQSIFPLRGNHESRHMTQYFNFRQECLYKFDQDVYDAFISSFDNLPIACLLNNKFLALHGGISPELKKLRHLNEMDRFLEPPKEGLFCDILWSDPVENDKGASKDLFEYNETRGCSYYFGKEAANAFLKKNNLYTIIRAHEVQIEGYKMHNWSTDPCPMVLTLFSAPNYVGQYNNKGAVVIFEQNTLQIQQFNYSAQPYCLPDFMDVFSWSVPFVMEKISEVLLYLAQTSAEGDDDEDDEEFLKSLKPEFREKLSKVMKATAVEKEPKEEAMAAPRSSIMKNKVNAISKMIKMQRLLRENNETIIKIKNKNNNKLPAGILLEGKDALDAFTKAKTEDKMNEGRPKYKK